MVSMVTVSMVMSLTGLRRVVFAVAVIIFVAAVITFIVIAMMTHEIAQSIAVVMARI